VEKPIGVNMPNASELRDAVEVRPGVHLQVGPMRRFDPEIAFTRDFICEELGVVLISAETRHYVTSSGK
jgi:predicted dehydrogenase